jgi:hypothetical protein
MESSTESCLSVPFMMHTCSALDVGTAVLSTQSSMYVPSQRASAQLTQWELANKDDWHTTWYGVCRYSYGQFPCHCGIHCPPTAHHWTLSQVTLIHSTVSHYTLLRSTLMLSCHSHLGHPRCFFHSNPCYSSAYCSPASDCGGLGSNPGQSRWDFSWAIWCCANWSPSTMRITPSMLYIHSLIYPRRYITLATDSVIK